MAKDITINNASYIGVPEILIPLSDGSGMATFIADDEVSTDVPFEYGGFNAQKVATYSSSWTLADTSFVVGSSASTSSTSIRAATANMFSNTTGSPTIAYGDKDIVVVQKCFVEPTYGSGAVDKARQICFANVNIAYISKRKTTDTSNKTTRQVHYISPAMCKYYNTSGVITRNSVNYGFYMSTSTPAANSSSSNSTYVRCGSPTLYYRVNSSYMSSANIKTVTDCSFKWLLDVYTVDPFSTVVATTNDDLDDMILNGLDI